MQECTTDRPRPGTTVELCSGGAAPRSPLIQRRAGLPGQAGRERRSLYHGAPAPIPAPGLFGAAQRRRRGGGGPPPPPGNSSRQRWPAASARLVPGRLGPQTAARNLSAARHGGGTALRVQAGTRVTARRPGFEGGSRPARDPSPSARAPAGAAQARPRFRVRQRGDPSPWARRARRGSG